MDEQTSAQFTSLKESFARAGTRIEAAFTPDGNIDYIYAVNRVLARDSIVGRLRADFPNLSDRGRVGDLVQFSTENVKENGGSLSVPELLDRIDSRLGYRAALGDDGPPVSCDYVVHITKICPAGEPEVPSGYPTTPWPPVAADAGAGKGVRVLVVDTGILKPRPTHAWLAGVDGEDDELGPLLPSGQHSIPQYVGHGTFVAGMVRCMAPAAEVYVGDHFTKSGGELESVIIAKLEALVTTWKPHIVCLPAGTYTRRNWTSLGFSSFRRRHPKLVLVASAGNDSTSRPFYPAALPWVTGVGALGTDEEHRAWFSNHGTSSDVYALGEGTVNAYASGLYTYQEPPKRPAQQSFTGMARWDGTSYSAPLVAGLIAAELTGSQNPADEAATAAKKVLDRAVDLPGVGKALKLF